MNIYKALAEKYGMTAFEMKREMQTAIDQAYKHPNAAAQAVPRKGAIPTAEEFIDYVVSRLHNEKELWEESAEQSLKRGC